VAWDNG